MAWRIGLVAWVVFAFAACASAPVEYTQVPETLSAARTLASTLVWQTHPCAGKSGVPFKKYTSFALDAATGTLYGRKNEKAEPVALQDKPKGGGKWNSPTQFFEEKGITKACGGEGPQLGAGKGDGSDDSGGSGKENDFNGSLRKFIGPIHTSPTAYYSQIDTTHSNADFRASLHKILSQPHVQTVDRPDQVVEKCPEPAVEDDKQACVEQKQFTYEGVRRVMMGDPTLGDFQNIKGELKVWDYYCQTWRGAKDFKGQGPDFKQIVDHTTVNVEHTWPQSKFTAPKGSAANLMQKTDLHHIFNTDSKVNALRGNYEFANVDTRDPQRVKEAPCDGGRLGPPVVIPGATVISEQPYFEPKAEHKGNVARALFYFSVRYNAGMSSLQEAYLRQWHVADPPDRREIARHEAVYKINGVRNPFIDHPEWVRKIDRFCRVVPEGTEPGALDCAK